MSRERSGALSSLWTALVECRRSGHRANDWDVNKWLWQGQLKVQAQGSVLSVLLVDSKSGELFATCPATEPHSKAIDPVVDSSRYFVLRIDDGKGRHAFIGMGFRDRSEAYDFNATVQDHWNGVKRQAEADAMRAEMEARLATQPMRDLSLKEGEKLNIKVNVPGGSGRERPKRAAREGGLTLPGGLLPPPPKPGMLASPPKPAAPPQTATAEPTPAATAEASTAQASTAAAPAADAEVPAPAAATADDGFGDFNTASGQDDGFGDFSVAGNADGDAATDDGSFGDFSSG